MCERTLLLITRLHSVYRLSGSVSTENTEEYKRDIVLYFCHQLKPDLHHIITEYAKTFKKRYLDIRQSEAYTERTE